MTDFLSSRNLFFIRSDEAFGIGPDVTFLLIRSRPGSSPVGQTMIVNFPPTVAWLSRDLPMSMVTAGLQGNNVGCERAVRRALFRHLPVKHCPLLKGE